ncbi:MAG: hypothetical protein JEZ02_16385 [Desulfatibacillum sp.]|nr:hypothetical protein [Desulfatibacillum sp.]
MSILETIDRKELRELLCMGWITHDGMWFYNVFQKYGAKAASDLNRAAIQAMSAFEVPRLKTAMGVEEVSTYEQLKDFVEGAFDLIGADFMQFKRHYPGNNVVRWEAPEGQCFAYKGVKRIGALDDYDCGIFYRVETWLKELGIGFQVTPEVHGCLIHQGKPCYREYVLDL